MKSVSNKFISLILLVNTRLTLRAIVFLSLIFLCKGIYAQVHSFAGNNGLASDSLTVNTQDTNCESLLNTNPQDVYVFHNDSLIGNTPLFAEKKLKYLTLKKDGYEEKNITLDELSSGKIISLNFIGANKEKSFFDRDIFKILTAGIVVLGGATAYFKLKADNKFDEYQYTGQNKYLDETRKYDLISGVTFTALQINFGLLLYYFLIE